MDVVVGGVDLHRAGQRVGAAPVLRTEPASVHSPEVEAGLAVDDPLRHQAAHAARAGYAVGAEPGGHEQSAHRRLAKDELVVGRESLRPVDQPDHLTGLQPRHPLDRVLRELAEALPVFG